MKRFNIAGKCIPGRHYMVDISARLVIIKSMIDQGDYFCINRGRQFGKTTTLNALSQFIANEYLVFQISFEGLDDSIFSAQSSLMQAVLRLMRQKIVRGQDPEIKDKILPTIERSLSLDTLDSIVFIDTINELCSLSSKPVVLLIDEVDQAGNYETFVKFLGVLRNMYLDRDNSSTFQSVILAGVYDIKNLKLKIRGAGEHQYNSPWNIAVPFDEDMSLPADGIKKMLDEYEADHKTGMDTETVAKSIFDYTSGYPFLVSRLCMLMDENNDWTKEGLLISVKKLVCEPSTLFDDIQKKMSQFPQMEEMFRNILYRGISYPYNYADKEMELATRFGIIKSDCSIVTISNRVFETYLYNYFVTEAAKSDPIYKKASNEKPQFIKNGQLDMPLILSRFVQAFYDIYGNREESFVEDEGRKYFMLYIKPIINGTGNYYVEAQTRDGGRTDLVIDYLGKQYVIEMKIWHGNAYNERGEHQLTEYLDYFHLTTGYMLSFCFNKNKQPGLKVVTVCNRTIYEAIV